jgi:hypothetical protein
MKKIMFILAGFFLTSIAMANDVPLKSFRQDPFNHPDFPIFALFVFGIIVLILLIAALVISVRAMKVLGKSISAERNSIQQKYTPVSKVGQPRRVGAALK